MAWTPLESNPEVMNKFLCRLGVPDKWQIVDVLSLDKDMLGLIPTPTLALILLFPSSEKYEKLKQEQEAKILEKGQNVSSKVYYLKQKVSNSCGSVALVHSVANNQDEIQLGDGFLKQFLEDTKSMDPEERGAVFESNSTFAAAHQDLAVEGQTEVPSDDNPPIHHFVAFIHKDGEIYELDGRKAFPINHGSTTPETFVEDAGKVMMEIMKNDPDNIAFTVCALAAKTD
ncbi:ubiquitin carboxyl-terminal hydrolase [Rhodnius prolixus]|uniref:Ubiquitin carboxyl-terminal hydrolase n=2 Tax=Rhodnius TaxID=13248 RepID=R4G8N5_RHOPR